MKPTPTQYAQVLMQLSQESPASAWPAVSAQFLSFLNRRKEIKKLPAILRNFERLSDEVTGVKRVQVTTATTLNYAVMQSLTHQIKQLFATENIALDSRIDAQIIGGLKLQTETELYDTTIRKRLSELKKVLL